MSEGCGKAIFTDQVQKEAMFSQVSVILFGGRGGESGQGGPRVGRRLGQVVHGQGGQIRLSTGGGLVRWSIHGPGSQIRWLTGGGQVRWFMVQGGGWMLGQMVHNVGGKH